MALYVSSVILEVNGQKITDFSAWAEGEVELAKQVELMGSTGHALMTPRNTCQVDYVEPVTGGFDWRTLRDGRLTVEKDGGGRITFTGVYTLKIGEGKADGKTEMTRTITLGAEGRVEE